MDAEMEVGMGMEMEVDGPEETAAMPPARDAPEASFSYFPRLPVELQVQIWREAAMVPRVVLMLPETADTRCVKAAEAFAAGYPARPTLRPRGVGMIDDGVPVLLHTTHQSRQVCLPIYKHRFQIRGLYNELWETYLLADHDLLAMSVRGLMHLVYTCRRREEELNRNNVITRDADREAWRSMVTATTSSDRAIELDHFRRLTTPSIVEHLRACMVPPEIDRFRGDLAVIKRLLLFNTNTDETWPGMYRDPTLLANLDRAFPLLAACTLHNNGDRALVEEARRAQLPDRYLCHPHPCPHHPGACDRKRASVAISRTSLDQSQWLASIAATYQAIETTQGAQDRVMDTVLSRNWARPARQRHDLVLWCFSAPRFLREPLPADADEATRAFETYAAYIQAYIWGASWQTAALYEGHGPASSWCPWLPLDYRRGARDPPPPETVTPTPGCPPCAHPPPRVRVYESPAAIAAQREAAALAAQREAAALAARS